MLSIANKILSILTILSQLALLSGLFLYFIFPAFKNSLLYSWIKKNRVPAVFLISLLATLGSLFYSEIIGFEPCKLCWLQRIFMYPLVFIAGTGIIKKAGANARDFILSLAVPGTLIAIYHNYIYITGTASACSALGASCIKKFVVEYNYITIPMMSLTAFVLIIFLLLPKHKA